MTSRWRSRLKISVTLTLMPSAMTCGDRLEALDRRGDLDHHVRPADLVPELLGLGDRARRCRGRAPARPRSRPGRPAPPVASQTGRKISRAVADVARRDLEHRVVGRRAGLRELRDLSVVGRSPSRGRVAKIVGFVVTPTTLRSSISFCRLPETIRSRRQVVEPDADAEVGQLLRGGGRSCSFSVSSASRRERFLGGGYGGLGGDPELLEQGLVVGGRAEVLDRDAPAGVADDRGASRARGRPRSRPAP